MFEPREVRSDLSGFVLRHLGPDKLEVESMLARLGVGSLDELVDSTIPDDIRYRGAFDLEAGLEEEAALDALRERASANELFRSFIGMGYYGTITPAVIQRGVLENPAWYTAYTPYQAEISQGRLEALVGFQTLVCDLTGLEVANASLLDEATAAAEAMSVALQTVGKSSKGERSFLVDVGCHPHTVDVLETRARALGVEVRVADLSTEPIPDSAFGVLLQTPSSDGSVRDQEGTIRRAHDVGALVTVATDLLALTMIRPPGELGADMAVGSSQRFGVPMGFGGPHAGFLAARESLKRRLPGRIVGVSRDVAGRVAYRLALQTREQHIRREKATSNICTAQVLPAVLAAMYAVYHGPEGLLSIARRVHELARRLAIGVAAFGHDLQDQPFFDTLRITPCDLERTTLQERALEHRFNLRWFADGAVGISLDETTSETHVEQLIEIFATDGRRIESRRFKLDETILRTSPFMQHPIFHLYRSETEMMRYLHRLADKDLSLTRSMIALGSCTMKLNAASEMQPISWPGFAHLHPFAPREQTAGYAQLFSELETMLCTLTGFAAVSLQPNAGSQGEYAGLLAIGRHHEGRGEAARRVCLIPRSAHGTNPASAVMAGMSVLGVACDKDGNIELEDLRAKAKENRDRLAALMVTYPSTHGVFEESIREVCEVVHENGGQVYMDGANFNAMVGLCRPADLGVDVCHLNLHKTFCIPHGGGGPGVGPIGVAAHLVDSLPGHSVVAMEGRGSSAAVAAAPWGSASILPISWMYIRMMGLEGLQQASRISILNANYVAARLSAYYPILYTGSSGRVAHECILDLRPLKKSAGVEVEDVAKRLIDYGFHAPTVSWPVAGTLMVEPTESENQAELDRFCEAMIGIREEVRAIERGDLAVEDSALRHAPHPAETLVQSEWDRVYSREEAAYPAPWLRAQKYWPPVGRIDNVYGDRNLVCSCPPMEAYELDDD